MQSLLLLSHKSCHYLLYHISGEVVAEYVYDCQNGYTVKRNITQMHLNSMFTFRSSAQVSHISSQLAKNGDILLHGPISKIIELYSFWHKKDLLLFAKQHNIKAHKQDEVQSIIHLLKSHHCTITCLYTYEYLFHSLKFPRPEIGLQNGHDGIGKGKRNNVPIVGIMEEPPRIQPVIDDSDNDVKYLEVADDALKTAIIKEWEQAMSTKSLKDEVCAICARYTKPNHIIIADPLDIDLQLLQNPQLPLAALPKSYNLQAYANAILHPKGMLNIHKCAPLKTCKECYSSICDGELPKYSLANWLYYGHDALPINMQHAIKYATHAERILVSRARASTISFRFSDIKGHSLEGSNPLTSQHCIKGNVSIHPQDVTHLNNALPPSNDTIRDLICAVFVGQTQPTKDTIKKLRPMLV